jgi:hypothetical protein
MCHSIFVRISSFWLVGASCFPLCICHPIPSLTFSSMLHLSPSKTFSNLWMPFLHVSLNFCPHIIILVGRSFMFPASRFSPYSILTVLFGAVSFTVENFFYCLDGYHPSVTQFSSAYHHFCWWELHVSRLPFCHPILSFMLSLMLLPPPPYCYFLRISLSFLELCKHNLKTVIQSNSKHQVYLPTKKTNISPFRSLGLIDYVIFIRMSHYYKFL